MADMRDLYQVKIDPEIVSRGSGKPINRGEATVFDYMPRIIGDRFRFEPLKDVVHFYGNGIGPFLAQEMAYRDFAIENLRLGDLNGALEAYKRGLHHATSWVNAVASFQHMALLNSSELNNLQVGEKFEALEHDLISRIVASDVAFDLQTYIEFLDKVRHLERDALQLNRIYFMGAKGLPHEDLKGKDNPETGRRLRDTYAEMRQFSNAAWISQKLGETGEETKFRKLAETQPKNDPRFERILDGIMNRYYSDY